MRSTEKNSLFHSNPACTCGCSRPHPISHRWTADGARVAVWSNGDLFAGYDFVAHAFPIDDLHKLADRVELFDFEELPGLIAAARCGRFN